MANRDIITRAGKGAAIDAIEHDQNHNGFAGTVDRQSGATYTVIYTDQNKTIELNNAAMVCTLDSIATIAAASDTDNWKVTIKNINLASASITGSETFDGSGTLTLKTSESVILQTNSLGNKWNIIGGSNLNSLTVWGNSYLGDADTDSIKFNGRAISDLIPLTTATYNLGNNTTLWQHLYLSGVGVINTLRLASGVDVNETSTDGTLSSNLDTALVTEKAIKTYSDTKSQGVYFTGRGSTGACVITNANNISAVSRAGAGVYNVALSNAKATANYRVIVYLETAGASVVVSSVNSSSKTVNAFTINCVNTSGVATDPSFGSIYIL